MGQEFPPFEKDPHTIGWLDSEFLLIIYIYIRFSDELKYTTLTSYSQTALFCNKNNTSSLLKAMNVFHRMSKLSFYAISDIKPTIIVKEATILIKKKRKFLL